MAVRAILFRVEFMRCLPRCIKSVARWLCYRTHVHRMARELVRKPRYHLPNVSLARTRRQRVRRANDAYAQGSSSRTRRRQLLDAESSRWRISRARTRRRLRANGAAGREHAQELGHTEHLVTRYRDSG